MKVLLLTCFVLGTTAYTVYYPATYNNLGCWKDTSNRAITPREGDPVLDGASYTARIRAIGKCAQVAHSYGDEVFAVQNGGWCASSAAARQRYRMYGASSTCQSNGKGGPAGNQVYELVKVGKVTLESLGCWKDTANRAIPTLEKLDNVLDGNFWTRQEAIAKCVQAGFARGYDIIALQAGGWCAGSRDADKTYMIHGPADSCPEKGGDWINHVYRLRIKSITEYSVGGKVVDNGCTPHLKNVLAATCWINKNYQSCSP